PELKGLTPINPACLKNAGLDVAICTDHPVIPIQYLSLSAAVSSKSGLPYEDALKSITINAARITGIEQTVGSIKVGKDADIILFNGNPLDVMVEPYMVIVNGNIVKSV
ncbi:MAG: amidohydrolase family protein, partial [Oscillospiraceae bacterium]